MKSLVSLAWASAWNRRYTLGLILLTITLSVALLLAIERLRHETRDSFSQAVSGVDLVVGARTSPMQLMLYSVFRIGDATHNMQWKSFQAVAARPEVAWAVPLSLGDSHRGFPVLGTNQDYFTHFKYGAGENLRLAAGKRFEGLFDAVVGAEVAAQLGYVPGTRIVLNHGAGADSLTEHADKPFVVSGVLARTGTPVDRTVHVSLEAIEAIHLDWQGGAPIPGVSIPAEMVRKFDLTPKTITAMFVGLKNRSAVFRSQRQINSFEGEALLAVLPGVALDELWRVVEVVERTLMAVSLLVVGTGLASLVAVMLAGLNERRRELAILRAVGARPRDITFLVLIEGFGVTLIACLLALLLLALATWWGAPLAQAHLGMALEAKLPLVGEWLLLGAVLVAGLAASAVPAWRAYRLSLGDGLTPRI